MSLPFDPKRFQERLRPSDRSLIRQIAKEDKTNFSEALSAYLAMIVLVQRVTKSENDNEDACRRRGRAPRPYFDSQAYARQLLGCRKTMECGLARVVRTIDAESMHDRPLGLANKSRPCQKDGCDDVTHESSYRFCLKHLPESPETDDGDMIYCTPPPRGAAAAIKRGAEKIRARMENEEGDEEPKDHDGIVDLEEIA